MSVESLKKDVAALKNRVKPEAKHYIIDFNFSTLNDPHGILNGSLLHLVVGEHGKENKWCEAIDTQTEINSNKAYYEQILSRPTNKFMKSPDHPFHSFESFLEYLRCKCGKHGADNLQPYLGENV